MIPLHSIQVVHLLKRQLSAAQLLLAKELISQLGADAFAFDSCQRLIWIFGEPVSSGRLPSDLPWEKLSAESGYEFLLRVVTGLESEIIGETDVFGQFKEAWRVGGG